MAHGLHGIPGSLVDPWIHTGSLDPRIHIPWGRVRGIGIPYSARDLPVDHGVGGLVGIVGLPSTARVLGVTRVLATVIAQHMGRVRGMHGSVRGSMGVSDI